MSISTLAQKLNEMDLSQMREAALADIRSGKKTKRQAGVKMLRAIDGLQRNNMRPADLLISKVPVIPAAFRPYTMAGDTFVPGDANELYSDLIKATQIHNENTALLGAAGTPETAGYVRNAVRAVYGYGDSPNPKIKSRKVSGFLSKILGSGPKTSWVQQKLLAKPQDFVGRGVISPDPDLGMDEVGIPEDMAWDLYDAHVRRAMASQGIPVSRTLQMIKERDPKARAILESEMRDKPVIYSRAPAWHKHNVISGYAKISEGHNIMISPLVTAGLAGDFDGDDHCNSVLYAIPLRLKSTLRLHFIDLTEIFRQDPTVYTKLNIPVLDTETHAIGIIDLEDFPRGELLKEKQGEHSYIYFHRALSGCRVVAYDEETHQPVWAEVSGWSRHVGSPLEIVTLENRRQIFTDDDPRAVYGVEIARPYELRRFTPSEALRLGVLVPFVRNSDKLLESLGVVETVTITEVADCTFREQELDFDFGWFLGALCGDGWWDKRDHEFYALRRLSGKRTIHLADLPGHNATRLKEFIARRLDLEETLYHYALHTPKQEGDQRYGATTKHAFNFKHSELLAEFLTEHLGGERDKDTAGSANKHLPTFAFQAPEEFRRGFLCGMMDTDGSCSVSMAKGKEQLLCAITSTSLRLVRELQMLTHSLGVQSSVTFSKTTSAGNSSWMLSLSAADSKRLNLFERLACECKRKNFVGTAVAQENTSLVFDKVVFPTEIAELLLSDIPATRPEGGEQERRQYNVWFRVNRARTNGLIARAAVREAIELINELCDKQHALLNAVRSWCASYDKAGAPFVKEDSDRIRKAIRVVAPKGHALYREGCRIAARINKPLRDGHISGHVLQGIGGWLSAHPPAAPATASDVFLRWSATVMESKFSWTRVVSVEKTGKQEVGYDLTVPGYETFMSVDGIILSNTMGIHVPALPEALKDAKEKLLPSRMLFSVRSRDTTLPQPKHEMILGTASAQLNPSGVVHKFSTQEEALNAIKAGQVKLQDQVEIGI